MQNCETDWSSETQNSHKNSKQSAWLFLCKDDSQCHYKLFKSLIKTQRIPVKAQVVMCGDANRPASALDRKCDLNNLFRLIKSHSVLFRASLILVSLINLG